MVDFKVSVILQAIDKMTKPSKGIAASLEKIRDRSRKLKESFSALSSKAVAGLKRMGIAAVGVYGSMSALVLKTTAMGDNIGKTAAKLGIGTKQLQEYRFAAERAGIENAEFDTSFQMFTRNIGEAVREGTGPAFDAFQEMQISLRDQNGLVKTNSQLFKEMADKISKVGDRNKQLSLAQDLMGRSGANMINMLDGGSKGLDEMAKRLEKIGGIMTDKNVKSSETLTDSITDMQWSIKGMTSNLIGEFMPTISKTVGRVTDWIGANKGLISSKATEYIQMLIDVAKGFWSGVTDVVAVVQSMVEWLGELMGPTEEVTNRTEKLAAMGSGLAKILAGLVAIKLAAFVAAIIAPLISVTAATWGFTTALLACPLTWIVVAIGAVIGGIVALVKNWDWVKDTAIKVWNAITDVFTGFFDTVGSLFDSAVEWGSSFIHGIWDGIKSAWGWLVDKFTAAWDASFGWIGDLFGGDEVAAVQRSPAGGVARAAAGANMSQFQGKMVVEVNGPPGTRIRSVTQDGNADMDVDTGLSMALT